MNNFSFFKFVSNTIYSWYAKLCVIYIYIYIYIFPPQPKSQLRYWFTCISTLQDLFIYLFILRIQTRSHNPSRFKKVKLKKSQKEKEKAFYLIPRTQPHYFLKYQIQKHPAIDAYMPHREKCVWVGERKGDRASGASSL